MGAGHGVCLWCWLYADPTGDDVSKMATHMREIAAKVVNEKADSLFAEIAESLSTEANFGNFSFTTQLPANDPITTRVCDKIIDEGFTLRTVPIHDDLIRLEISW